MTDKKQQEHLGEFNRDFAVFLPATSGFYQNYISKQRMELACSTGIANTEIK